MGKSKTPKQPKIKVNKNMRDYTNEPAFVKGAERAKEFLKKHGLPKSFEKKSNDSHDIF